MSEAINAFYIDFRNRTNCVPKYNDNWTNSLCFGSMLQLLFSLEPSYPFIPDQIIPFYRAWIPELESLMRNR